MAVMDDIAKKLGVSRGTVSKALNGAPDVSERTRTAVAETAVELGYKRLPRRGRTGRLCIFEGNMPCGKPGDAGWPLAMGFRKCAEPAGYETDVLPIADKSLRGESYDGFMMKNGYQGAFFVGTVLPGCWAEELSACRTPAVLYENRVRGSAAAATVGVDCEEAMSLTVEALRELGHRRIGCLSGPTAIELFRRRREAFYRALRLCGLESDPGAASYSDTDEELERRLSELLEWGCTALVCAHDRLAHAVMLRCAERGLDVPEDVSVTGFDDSPLCLYTTPSLASVRIDGEALGRSAFAALMCLREGVPVGTLLLRPEFVRRGSIGPAPRA